MATTGTRKKKEPPTLATIHCLCGHIVHVPAVERQSIERCACGLESRLCVWRERGNGGWHISVWGMQ